jgi:hypothetical protein
MASDDQARETGADPGSLSRRSFLALSATAAATVVLPGIDSAAAAAQGNCQPFLTPPEYLGIVPTTEQVLGFEAGRREVTTAQCYKYLDAVAAASDRVRVGVVGHSSTGREIRYAIVGRPEHVTDAGLEKVRQAHYEIADPSTTQSRVDHLADTTPAFLWVCGNIHGDEESGADAIISLVYGLADRDDCVVNRILKDAVVVVIPIQNPDGRALDTRSNYYAFDLNRDHFGRTQPETDGKIQLMRKYPPLVLTDHHEFGYYRSFFPPTDDPVYHEVTNRQIHDIYDVYGPAMGKEFRRRGWHYFNQGYGYDFFSPIFTDTLTSFGFQGAGMTVEVYDGTSIYRRWNRHHTVMWVTLAAAAARRRTLHLDRHTASVQAVEQGRKGVLMPNRVYEPENSVRVKVPGTPVRHYFIRADRAESLAESKRLVRKLQRMDVQVYRLTHALTVPDYRPHREEPRHETLPAGTFWIPMAQRQKHWVQAAMNEDTFVPINQAYGLTGFSLALLSGAATGWSGAHLDPHAKIAPPLPQPPAPKHNSPMPRIKIVWVSEGSFYSWQGTRWLQFLFDHEWGGIPHEVIDPQDIRQGALQGTDVLCFPAGGAPAMLGRLGHKGQRAIVDWVNRGGRYIGWRWGGSQLPWALGLSTARYGFPSISLRDILVRARLDPSSPLTRKAGKYAWFVYDYDLLMWKKPAGNALAAWFPKQRHGGIEVNGYPGGTRLLLGQGVVADERAGRGRVITSGLDPNYRDESVGARKILWNAVFGPDPDRRAAAAVTYDENEVARRMPHLIDDETINALLVSVPPGDAAAARSVLAAFGSGVHRVPTFDHEAVLLAVDNPDVHSFEQHPFAREIPGALQGAGIEMLGFRAPE